MINRPTSLSLFPLSEMRAGPSSPVQQANQRWTEAVTSVAPRSAQPVVRFADGPQLQQAHYYPAEKISAVPENPAAGIFDEEMRSFFELRRSSLSPHEKALALHREIAGTSAADVAGPFGSGAASEAGARGILMTEAPTHAETSGTMHSGDFLLQDPQTQALQSSGDGLINEPAGSSAALQIDIWSSNDLGHA